MGFTKLPPVTIAVAAVLLLWASCSHDSSRVVTAPVPLQPTAAQTTPRSPAEAPSPVERMETAEVAEAEPFSPQQISLEKPEEIAEPDLSELDAPAIEQAPGQDIEQDGEPASEDELALIDELNDSDIPDDFDIEGSGRTKLSTTRSTLPLVLNPQVAKFINYFKGRGKKTYIRSIERAGAYRGMIERILEEEGVPLELFHLAQAESGFRPKARSHKYATGMWQFIKFRGKQYGLRQDRYVDERYDPEKATRAAAQHLHDLYIEFGDWYLAMAAYNGGPSRVKTAIRRTGSKDFWVHSRRRFVRRETRNYVPIILAMTYVGKNEEMYGIEIKDPAPPLEYDTIETDTEIHFDLIADITGTSAATIKQLNPALLRSATPPYDYKLRLPKNTGETFVTEVGQVPPEQRLAWRRHQVRDGESLDAIAKRYKVKASAIVAHNRIDNGAVMAGMRLTVPAPKARLSFYGGSSGGAGGFLEPGTGRYRIVRGDNLGSISRRFNVSIANLRTWNGLSGNRIRAGRYLIVRPEGVGKKGSRVVASASSGSETYRIRRGDTLGTVARRFGVTVAQLKGWNGLTSNRITAGDTLTVGTRKAASLSRRASGASSRARPTSTASRAASSGGTGQYKIRRGDNLAIIAQRFGVTVADLKSWNRLRSSRIRAGKYLTVRPPDDVPASSSGARASVASNRAAPSRKAAGGERYKIRRGDNLELIARRFSVDVADLKSWNSLRGNRIKAGEYLVVHSGSGSTASTLTAKASAKKPTPKRQPTSALPANGRYRIRRGDNLGAIAERFGVSVTDLRRWNGLRGNRITAGESLNVTQRARTAASPSLTASADSAVRYRIREGDTLDAIAKRFGVRITDLKAWNGLRNSRIRAGRYLTVEPASGGS